MVEGGCWRMPLLAWLGEKVGNHLMRLVGSTGYNWIERVVVVKWESVELWRTRCLFAVPMWFGERLVSRMADATKRD